MVHKDHNQLLLEGFVYMSRKHIPYSNDERRLYTHKTEGCYVLYLRGIEVVESHKYPKTEYEAAYHHLKNGIYE